MAFCSKCGNEISISSVFCSKCGAPVDQADPGPMMSTEESIVYIHNLREKLTNIEKLKHEIDECEKRLAKPLELNYRSYSFFRFYWPYIIWAVVSYFILAIIALIVSDSGSDGATIFFLILAYGTPIAFLIAGIFLANKKKGSENYAIYLGNEKVKEQREKLEKETTELRTRLSLLMEDLTAYNKYVPPRLLTTPCMAKLNALIQSGKASSLQEAIRLMD